MIFNLFKSKPTLKELIPNGFVDIHSHILPGIDDGAKNIDESLELISQMKNLGFSKIIGTPHTYPGVYDNTNNSIKKAYSKVLKELDGNHNITYASEYMLDESLIVKAKNKELLTVYKNHILVEMSFVGAPINLYEIIYEIMVNGYIPILAHPERYLFMLNNNLNEYFRLKKVGCLFQINLLSVLGYYGKDVLKITDKLLSKNLVNFVGSDIHNIHQIDYINNPKNTVKLSYKNIEKLEKVMNNNKIFG